MRDAEPLAGRAGHALEELGGVEVLPAQPVDVGLVRLQRRDAGVERVGDVDGVRRLRRAGRPHLPDAAPRLEPVGELLGEDPAVAGVADGVERGLAGGDVVGLVEVAAAPGVAEVVGDHDVGPVPADGRGDRPAQRHAVLQDAVGQAEEVDRVDADDPRGLDLLGLADRRGTLGSMPSMPASPLVTMQ